MDEFLARYYIVARIVAWIAICGVVILTVVPANDRPNFAEWWLDERIEHLVEHFSAFALVAAAFTIGYYRLPLHQLLLLALFFSAGLELLQIPLPTRHARVSDFVVDFAALCITIVVVRLTTKTSVEQRA
jgi:VanZ family protein